MQDHRFQVSLRGIIDLLSQHLYSGPQVFVRELLQNAVDAIRARCYREPGHEGEIRLEVIKPRRGRPTLAVIDNGIGLTEEEVHRFLATIGESSKRRELWDRPADFIGQFGIGILSCFMVSQEIVVVTRSVKGNGKAVEWRGRNDGTYSVKTIERDIEPGTQVYLQCRKGSEEFFETERVEELARHFGGLLPYPVHLTLERGVKRINEEDAPWRVGRANAEGEADALLAYGRSVFNIDFFDAIPLRSAVGDIEGVAFVLPFSPSLASRKTHRVYLKSMLLSEQAENLLPEWAFFVKCVVNANDLRPTASRESFYEDDKLAAAREALGGCLRDYLVSLARHQPRQLQRFIVLHHLAIKALAVHDDELFKLFIDWLPFETSLGDMSLGEYRRRYEVIRYVPTLDQFRQIARVAAAQDLCIVNGAYTYCTELLEKCAEVFPETRVEIIGATALAQGFEDLSLDEQEQAFGLVKLADLVLQAFKCEAEVKKFRPKELPALYTADADAGFRRSVERSKEIADPLWSGVLDRVAGGDQGREYGPSAQLCFNFDNPLVRKLAGLKDRQVLQRCIQMLYVQSLLLGHHPLHSKEMALLNDGLSSLIECVVDAQKRGPGQQK